MTDGYTCPNCNSALSLTEKMTLGTMLLTTGTTLGSMLYFTYQFGIW
jgi:transcription initiation factor IIE alpha subunit